MQQFSRPLPLSAPDAGRPAVVVIRPSILRLGLLARFVGTACLVSGIWVVIGWVLK